MSHADSTRIFSQSILTCMTSTVVAERRIASDAMRREYLHIFERGEAITKDGQLVWKQTLQETGRMLLDQLLAQGQHVAVATASEDDATLVIGLGDRLHEIPAGQDVVLLGSRPECDIRLFYGSCSRLHALVYIFPKLGKLFVVDVGSLTGITTVSRGDTEASLVTSNANDRRVIECGIKETMVLRLGMAMVTLNVRACVVCMAKPRACIYTECGHFLVCKPCAAQVGNQCPCCRADVDAQAAAQRFDHACASLPVVAEPR